MIGKRIIITMDNIELMHPVSQTDLLPSYQDILPDAGRYQYSESHYYAQY